VKIKTLVSSYRSRGLSEESAKAHAGAEILLQKIVSSDLADRVTLKGGLLMYSLSKSGRRATADVDFDFIHYPIDDESIRNFVRKLRLKKDGIEIGIVEPILPLKHQDYQGKRLHVALRDSSMEIQVKIDIGIHTYFAIDQRHLLFACQSDDNGVDILANPDEQIFTEKIISLAKLGPISTRYKDIYDLFYLIREAKLSRAKTADCLDLFLRSGNYPFSSKAEVYQRVDDTLNDADFQEKARKPNSDWIQADYSEVVETILDFLFSL
jgi:predicted nucleotidyltransferase component of viral defense system